ncbi:MAG: SDR family oxidoreductase [Clostridiales bacterium]|nr:SDR family oxidoreductase [Clostridiales bacterium]
MSEIVKACKVDELFSLRDQVVLVVGAGGLGAYIGRGMAMNGAKVIFTNTTIEKAQKVQSDLAQEGLSCDIFHLDVTDDEQVREVVAAVADKYGRIDVLINTAGIGAHSEPENYPPQVVRQVVDVNLNGAIFVCREVGKVMIRQGGGKIINIGSIAGAFCHTYLSMPYECSKAALHQFTRSLAVTWAKYNINVNCIAPTWVYTPMLESFEGDTYEQITKQHPAGRMAEVNDFLGLAIYLSTPASNYVTGQVIYVDGGWSSGRPIEIPMAQRCVRE